MTDYVVTATLQDNISAGANAAADSMNKAADAADQLTASVTKVGPSAQSLVNRFDDTTKSANALAKAQQALAQATSTLQIAVDEGRISEDQRATVLAKLQTNVAAARDAMAATIPVSAALSAEHGVATAAANGASMAHAGFTRELVILGHEVVSGNYSRIPGSMMVLAERSGNLNSIISTLGSLVLGWPGIFAAGAVALALVGAAAESSQSQFLGLETRLKATRDDYAAMAAEAQAAARNVASSTGISTPDAISAAQTIAGSPNFTGTQAQLESLIKTAGDLAAVMGQTVPDAAKTLAEALNDPGKLAQELAQESFPGMTYALAETIERMQDMGDQAGATAKDLQVIQAQVDDARDHSLAPLQQALADIASGFRNISDTAGDAANKVIGFFASESKAAADTRAQMAAQGGVTTPIGDAFSSAYNALFPTSSSATAARLQAAVPSYYLPDVTVTAQGPLPTPPVPPVGGANASFVNQTVGVAQSRAASSQAGQIQKYTDQINTFKAALADLGPKTAQNSTEFDTLTNAIAADGKAIDDAEKKTETHVNELTKQSEQLIANTKAENDLATAYGQGAAAVDQVVAKQAAEKSLITDGLIPGTQKYNDALQQRIQLELQSQEATGAADTAKQVADANQTAAAQEAINAAYDGTTQSVTHAQDASKAYNELINDKLVPGTQQFTDGMNQLTAAYDRGSAATQQFQQEQSSIQELTSALGNAFDQLGQGIVDSFLNGTGAAVNFGSIVKSVIASVVTDLAKLAIVNPILNSITGGNNPTLGAALAVLGGGGSSAGGLSGSTGIGSLASAGGSGFSVLGGLSNISSLGSITDALGLSNIGETLGITGPNGILSSLGLSGGGNGILSGIGGVLGTPLIDGSASALANAAALTPAGAGLDAFDAAAVGSGLGPASLTVGSLLGGAGLGFGAGSLLDSLLGAKNPTIGTVGSGVGGLAGAAIGSIIPGIGTIFGGAIGGVGGGIFPTKRKNQCLRSR